MHTEAIRSENVLLLFISMLRCYHTRSLNAKGLFHLNFLKDNMVWRPVFSLFDGKLEFSFSLNRHKFGPLTIIQEKKYGSL